MKSHKNILELVKKSVNKTAPNARIILYGSYARGEQNKDSDLDLLIILDKSDVSRDDEKKIKYSLYDIEFDTGVIISPLVLSKSKWEQVHRKTPFYENVSQEGQVL